MSLVKTPEQVEKMRISGALLERCLDILEFSAKPGISGKELDVIAEEFILDHGGVPAFKGYSGGGSVPPFPASICFSRNNVVVHGIPTKEDIIEEGDLLTIDCGLSLDGWFADAARLIGVEEPDAVGKDIIDWTERVIKAGIDKCITGNKLGDICYAIQLEISRSSYTNVVHFTGHAIGQAMHESPQVPNFGNKGTGPVLKSGMVFCLEPMLTETNAGLNTLSDSWTIVTRDSARATHIESMVLVNEDKPEILAA